LNLTGGKIELVCDKVHITVNKNAVLGDRSALSPGGVRIGTPALTSRGLVESDFVKIADFMQRVVELTLEIQKRSGGKLLKDFQVELDKAAASDKALIALKNDVMTFARKFKMPGM